MYRLMQWCFGNRIDRFDFTIGDEGYKDSWCETRLELVDAALALTGLGGVTSGALRLREGAKRRIKADRTLWSATVSIRKALLSLRGS
jgi:CelD/BcsL family acetyltransferase involved in cellulose biosynthesis